MKKYRLTSIVKSIQNPKTKKFHEVFRIKYLIDIPAWSIKAGDLGGYIEREWNLSHEGLCAVKTE